jgi:hypothetical protein
MQSVSLEYGDNGHISENEINLIENTLSELSPVTKSKWGMRSGAIDLVTVLEVAGIFLTLKILDGLAEGIVGKNYFVKAGETIRHTLNRELTQVSKTFKKFYDLFLCDQQERKRAIAVIERFNGISIYAVLNHKGMTQHLLFVYAESMARACKFLMENDLGEDFSHMAQLYPSFQEDIWRYLFVPSNAAFGNHIDRYVDLNDMRIHEIPSKEEFMNMFPETAEDGFKFLVSPKRDGWDFNNV